MTPPRRLSKSQSRLIVKRNKQNRDFEPPTTLEFSHFVTHTKTSKLGTRSWQVAVMKEIGR